MLKKILYTILAVVFVVFVGFMIKNTDFISFLDSLENKTFDIRQNLIINSGYKTASKDIVIVAIDDASYEYILDKYGEWPLSRDMYAKIVDHLESQNPKAIAFDLLFVKSLKSSNNADETFSNIFNKYTNVYTALNFDNQTADLRYPVKLPETLSVNVKNNSKIDFSSLTFQNCRAILPQILKNTNNIGLINVSRSDDGILRKMPVFVKYQDKYYPQLAFKIASDLTNNNIPQYEISKKSILKTKDRAIYLDEDGSAILNWYGPAGTFEQIPLYKLINTIENGTKSEYDFHNKIVYFGTTAASLFDIKTTPTSKIYPGVEIQATYINNFLDNNFISKTNKNIVIFISVILAIITALAVIYLNSTLIITLVTISIYTIYVLISYFMMKYANIWIDMVHPLALGLITFISAFIIKYIIKSQDFDKQYVLATTDGLTDLYNHRYFQEQMRMQVETSKRYETPFSLIIIDIDFFKQFNDKFGHQAGDEVLRQVAQLLKNSVRATDIVCRYGGEEMSIILPNTAKDISVTTAEKICKRVSEKKFKIGNNQEGKVTISLGVATFPQDGETASDIIEVADKRLYQSKNNGRNQVN